MWFSTLKIALRCTCSYFYFPESDCGKKLHGYWTKLGGFFFFFKKKKKLGKTWWLGRLHLHPSHHLVLTTVGVIYIVVFSSILV